MSKFGFLPRNQAIDLQDHYVNEAQNGASYIRAFFDGGDLRGSFVVRTPSPITSADNAFIEAFRKVLDIVAPLA